MHALVKGQILRGGQRHAGRGDTLDSGVICKIAENHGAVYSAGAAELLNGELGLFKGDADSGEHDSEVFSVAQHSGLTGDLRCQICMGQTGGGEDGQLLAADQSVQAVNRADAV